MSENFLTLLKHQGLISITGQDAQKYLQGLVTIDIREINATQYRFGGCCNNKGRVVIAFDLFLYQAAYYLILPQLSIPIAIEHLRKYAMFSKVEIKEVTNDFVILGAVGGTPIAEGLQQIPEKAYQCFQEEGRVMLRLPGELTRLKVIVARACYTEKTASIEMLIGAQLDRWKRYEILSSMPVIYPQTSNLFTPQMLNFDCFNGISLNKGCYLGQEIVARTASLGSVKKHLHTLRMDSDASPCIGDALYNEYNIEIGVILDVYREDTCCYLSAVIQDSAMLEAIYWGDIQLQKFLS